MKLFTSVSIKKSIMALGLVGAAAAAAMAGSGMWMKSKISQSAQQVFVAKDVVADILPPPMYLVEMRLVLSQTVEGTITRDQAKQRFEALKKEYEARVNYWEANPPHGLERHLLGRQHEAAQRFMAVAGSQLISAPADASQAQLFERLKVLHTLYEAHRAGVDETVVAGNRFAADASQKFVSMQTLSRNLSFALLGVALCGVMLGYRWVYRQLERPLSACADWARSIAVGDLSAPAHTVEGRSDVIGELQLAMERMRGQLADLVATVRTSAEGVAVASAQIAQGNQDLATRTERQASALQQTAATMSELGAAVTSNADNARQASHLAGAASSVAERGGQVVGRVVEMIGGVNESSKRIADIIGVIDGIAFRTNILALNAAVEAARAGEQGRGFAVVAGEVRSLAQRSAAAACEIKKLINDSVERVAQSTELAGQAGHTMEDTMGSIRQLSALVCEISVASRSEAQGVAQVGQTVSLMDQSTQKNAALVEEGAAAAEGLKQQAIELVNAVAVFKLDQSVRTAGSEHSHILPVAHESSVSNLARPMAAVDLAATQIVPRRLAARRARANPRVAEWEAL